MAEETKKYVFECSFCKSDRVWEVEDNVQISRRVSEVQVIGKEVTAEYAEDHQSGGEHSHYECIACGTCFMLSSLEKMIEDGLFKEVKEE